MKPTKKDEKQAQDTMPAVPPQNTQLQAPGMSKADMKAMFGDLGASDITVPRITVLQGLSPEVTEGLGKPGELFVKGLNLVLGAEVEIIPILRSKSRIRWTPLQEGGGIRCQALDGEHGQGDPGMECNKCPMKDWEGNKAPICDVYENVIVVLRNSDDQIPMALSGSRTKLKPMRDLNTLFMTQMLKGRHLFTKSYIVKVVEKKNKMNLKYFSFKFLPGNNNQMLPESETQLGQKIFDSIKGRNLNILQEDEREEGVEQNPEL